MAMDTGAAEIQTKDDAVLIETGMVRPVCVEDGHGGPLAKGDRRVGVDPTVLGQMDGFDRQGWAALLRERIVPCAHACSAL